MRRILSVVAIVAALGLLADLGRRGVDCWVLHRNVAIAQKQASELRERYDRAHRRAQVAAAVAERRHPAPATGGRTPKAAGSAGTSPPRGSGATFVLRPGTDPRQFAAAVYSQWGLLLRRLALAPEDQDRLIAIECTYEAAKAQIHQEAADAGLTTSAPSYTAELHEAGADQTRDVRALLTPDEYSTFKAYSQQMSVVFLVTDLEKDELQTNLPDSTASALIDILASASRRDAYGWVQYGTVDWSAATPQAQSVLTPEQFQGFQSLATRKAAQWQLDSVANGTKR